MISSIAERAGDRPCTGGACLDVSRASSIATRDEGFVISDTKNKFGPGGHLESRDNPNTPEGLQAIRNKLAKRIFVTSGALIDLAFAARDMGSDPNKESTAPILFDNGGDYPDSITLYRSTDEGNQYPLEVSYLSGRLSEAPPREITLAFSEIENSDFVGDPLEGGVFNGEFTADSIAGFEVSDAILNRQVGVGPDSRFSISG